MPTTVIQGNVHVAGQLSSATMVMPNQAVIDANVNDAAGIDASKLDHQINKTLQRAVPAAETATIHIAGGAGDVIHFSAMCRTKPASGKSYTVDLKKNGSTILSSVITFNNSSTELSPQVATLSATPIVAGDILSVVVTDVAGGTLGTDLFVRLVTDEVYQAT